MAVVVVCQRFSIIVIIVAVVATANAVDLSSDNLMAKEMTGADRQ